MKLFRNASIFFVIFSLFATLSLTGCKGEETKDDGKVIVDNLAKQVKEGMTQADLEKMFGKADATAANEKAKAEDSEVWIYKKLDKFYDLEIRMVKGKATWATSQDKSAQRFTG